MSEEREDCEKKRAIVSNWPLKADVTYIIDIIFNIYIYINGIFAYCI